jgi:hypothetical protein
MDRSSISRQLSALEARLSARLCFRSPGGFELTDSQPQGFLVVCGTLALKGQDIQVSSRLEKTPGCDGGGPTVELV